MIIRLWMVSPFTKNSARRDGIARMLYNLINALLLRYNDIKIEIWCLDFTEPFIKKGLAQFCTKNVIKKITFCPGKSDILVKKINILDDDNAILLVFAYPALNYEKIDLRHKILIIHDFLWVQYQNLAALTTPEIYMNNKKMLSKINKLATKCFLTCNSQFVQKEHILKYTSITQDNTEYVYLPYIPYNKTTSVKQILKKYKIDFQYIIYPTQIRPYKNIEILLKSLILLKKKGYKIKLLLTGNLSDFPPALIMAEGNDLMDDIAYIESASNEELNVLYQNCAMCIATSFGEGGMPWPIFEALANNTPVIAANIAVTRERLIFCGIKPEESELFLFDPLDANELTKNIEYVLTNRDLVARKQQTIKDKLFLWQWSDVAEKYMEIFNRVLARGL